MILVKDWLPTESSPGRNHRVVHFVRGEREQSFSHLPFEFNQPNLIGGIPLRLTAEIDELLMYESWSNSAVDLALAEAQAKKIEPARARQCRRGIGVIKIHEIAAFRNAAGCHLEGIAGARPRKRCLYADVAALHRLWTLRELG